MSDSVRPHRRQPTRLPCPWDSLGKNTRVGSHFLLQCMKWKVEVKSLSRVRLFETPWTAAYEVPLSMGFSRQEYWSGLPLPSPLSVANYHLTGNCTNTPHKRRSIVSPLSALKHLKFGKPRRYHLVEQRLAQLILFSTNYILVLNNNLPFSLGRTGYWILCVC